MIKNPRHIPIIKNKKLFGKQLQKTNGFDEAKRSMGIDSRAMVFIPEHQILAVAGIHEVNDKPQQLTLYKIEATVDEDSQRPRFLHKRRSSQIGVGSSNKKRNSAIYSYSKTSLLENMVKAKLERSKESQKKGVKTNSGQSKNVGTNNSGDISSVIQEAEENLKSKVLLRKSTFL
jgi:hypothetical protein